MKAIVNILIFLLSVFLSADAQTYKYIGVEDGLSNRRIFRINQDTVGYIWFLTNEGVDRYNGKEIKQYKLSEPGSSLALTSYVGWLFMDNSGTPFVAGPKGRIYRYNSNIDRYEMIYKNFRQSLDVTYSKLDSVGNVWLCDPYSITIYNLYSGQSTLMTNPLNCSINDMVQISDSLYIMASELGICYIRKTENLLKETSLGIEEQINFPVSALYYHKISQKLYIGTFEEGLFVYDFATHQLQRVDDKLNQVKITRIVSLNKDELLIATEGMGIHKINRHTYESEPYVVTSNEQYNAMSGNNINDIYVDEEQRIWLADYPMGVTMIDNRYKNYHWLKHSPGNEQSLVNDHVYCVMQDSDGDLWFGTGNGISFYQVKTGYWHSFLDTPVANQDKRSHIIFALCELEPGIIYAGGYASSIYCIDKRTFSIKNFSSFLENDYSRMHSDKYIRKLMKDSRGYIWAGGLYGLKAYNPKTYQVENYPGINNVTSLAEKDDTHIWVGTATGLFLLDRTTARFQPIKLTEENRYISALYQDPNGTLYIGTDGAGLLLYNAQEETLEHYHRGNSALITNHIYSILPEYNGTVFMGTENGLACFSVKNRIFKDWTKEQGLIPSCLNATQAVLQADGSCIFGTPEGAVVFPADVRLPEYVYSPMAFTELRIAYQLVVPNAKDSPLKEHVNKIKRLKLKYNQNSLSLLVSSVNFDSPDNVFYKWKLDGYYDMWRQMEGGESLHLINLPPGDYTLFVNAYSKSEPYLRLEERTLEISISPPWWLGVWAKIGYLVIPALLLLGGVGVVALHKQKRIAEEKNTFFTNTAHNIRTPLTLIKAPLEELSNGRRLNDMDTWSLNTALRNVEALQQLTTNLINFEQADVHSTNLRIAEYELNGYLTELCEAFQDYAQLRKIEFTVRCDFNYLNVWFDKEKMDVILQNVLSNAMKYTPDGGTILFHISETPKSWEIELKDTGIGISSKDLKRLFHLYFRGSNAINSRVTGSGIGLPLVLKLVRLHGGKIDVNSKEMCGTTVYISFPKGKKHFYKYEEITPVTTRMEMPNSIYYDPKIAEEIVDGNEGQRLLIVEDNDELRAYLARSFAEHYSVRTCANGQEALGAVLRFNPDLVLADIMMPEMRGDELCATLKNNIETSHIPVVLLTALSDEQCILDALRIGADEYISKPFSISILRASIATLLHNRRLLREKYANLDLPVLPISEELSKVSEVPLLASKSDELDMRFLATVQKHIEDRLGDTDFTVDILCGKIGMSRTSFYNKLKALTGQGPADFIRTIRLKHAARLLVEEHLSVTEVAERTGFCDSKYFREVFKKCYGVNPRQYMKGENA